MTNSNFNRVARSFADDLARPEYLSVTQESQALADRFRHRGFPLRIDRYRDWEHAHVTVRLEELAREAERGGGPMRILDVGGGNAPIAYLLASRGFDVTVLDIDSEAVAATARHADALGLAGRLRAKHGEGDAWPLDGQAFDAVISISVIEGVLRSRRAAFFQEAKRALVSGGSFLLTFDYGEGARLVSDPPVTLEEVQRDLIDASGLQLAGAPFEVPAWDPEHGPPVKNVVPALNGFDVRVAEYSFGALQLRKS